MSKQKKEKQPPVLGRLLAYAGGHKWLSVLGCGLSGVSAAVGIFPFIFVWYAAKDSLALSTQHLHELVAFMYDHFDEFKLILCRAEGTGYADFIEVLVDLEVDRSEEYYALLRKNGMLSGSMTRKLHHMITRAYFTAVCETIVHDMPREEAMKYVDELAIFFHSGWSGLLRLE